ncbi:MAG: S66 peptidase family protein, partial [Stackebrandtia sp.]
MTSPIIRPPAVRPGDTVRLVAPSGSPKEEAAAAGIELLKGWGLNVEVSEHAFDRVGYLAGDDEVRASEFNAALRDPNVRAVMCIRGGYGASRMVDQVDFDAARRDPKPVTGYSDITVLHTALYARSGLVGIHGPVVNTFSAGHSPAVADEFRRALTTTDPITIVPSDDEATKVLTRGETAVSGRLLGGNLSLIVDAVGTPTFPGYEGAILFCEEINEEPYRVDRILTQLRRSGALDGVAGIALGQFTDCVDEDWSWDVVDVLR